jgi:hypothetical protein
MEFVFPCQDILSQMVYVVVVAQLILYLPVKICYYAGVVKRSCNILAVIFHIRINNGKFSATIFIETRKNEIK